MSTEEDTLLERTQSPLTPAEWHVMECLWQRTPCTGREATDYLSHHAGWSRSTTLTMLRRMCEKGLITCREANGMNTYSPLLRQEDATLLETQSFLQRVYHGSVSMLVNTFAKKQSLSQQEIDELYAILQQAKEEQGHD